jgi:hypothetical protein
VDGEGCFHVSILQNSKLKIGYMVSQWFEIHIHLKDEEVLIQIKEQLGVGNIYKSGQSARLKVQSIKELKILINFFEKYQLITQKRADYELFCDVVNLVEQKKHTTKAGLIEILEKKGAMNRGLPENLKVAFPSIIPVERPIVFNQNIPNPY